MYHRKNLPASIGNSETFREYRAFLMFSHKDDPRLKNTKLFNSC